MPIRKKVFRFNLSMSLFLLYLLYLESLVSAHINCESITLENGNAPTDMSLTLTIHEGKLKPLPYTCINPGLSSEQCSEDTIKWNLFVRTKQHSYMAAVDAQRAKAKTHLQKVMSDLDRVAAGVIDLTREQKAIFKYEKIKAKHYARQLEFLIAAQKSGIGHCHEQAVNVAVNLIAKYGEVYANRLEFIEINEAGGEITHVFLHIRPARKYKVAVEMDSITEDGNPLLQLNGTIIDPWNNHLNMSAAAARKKYPLFYASKTAVVEVFPFIVKPGDDISKLPLALRVGINKIYRRYDLRKLGCSQRKQNVGKYKHGSKFFKNKKNKYHSPRPIKGKRSFNSGR